MNDNPEQSHPATEGSSLPPPPLLLVIVMHHKNVSLVRPARCEGGFEGLQEALRSWSRAVRVAIVKV